MTEYRECYAEIEKTNRKTGKKYKKWSFIGYFPPLGDYLKSTKDFDYYQRPDGRYKYRVQKG